MSLKTLRIDRRYNAAIAFIGACIGIVTSFMLTVDSLILAATPKTQLGCDISGKLSCSSVAASWQANIIPLWGHHVPNAVFGIALFGIMAGFLFSLVLGFRPNRVIRWLLGIGTGGAVIFAGWLLIASVFSIKVLCPVCLTMDTGIILLVIGVVRWMRCLRYDAGLLHVRPHPEAALMMLGSWVSFVIELVPFALLGLIIVINI